MSTHNKPFINITKENHPKLSQICMGWVFSFGPKNEFETAVVNKPSVFESLKFYCTPWSDIAFFSNISQVKIMFTYFSLLCPFPVLQFYNVRIKNRLAGHYQQMNCLKSIQFNGVWHRNLCKWGMNKKTIKEWIKSKCKFHLDTCKVNEP